MDAMPGEKPPPESADLDGWRKAIADGFLPSFRLEAIVAAFQDLGSTDGKVRNALAQHLSDCTMKMLRRFVDFNHPNQGEDIIYRVHSDLFEALLDPSSADGKGLRAAFGPRVKFRAKDAIAVEYRHLRIPVGDKIMKSAEAKKSGDPEIAEAHQIDTACAPRVPANDTDALGGKEEIAPNATHDPSLLDGVRDLDEQIDVDRLLEIVTDDRKRLAFYLHMDGVPFGSSRGRSIAKALGKSSKIAEQWVDEVRRLLQTRKEVQELRKSSMGDKS
jgi:hypothetical protein